MPTLRPDDPDRGTPVRSLPSIEPPVWELVRGPSPLVATAIHEGHHLRPELARLMALDEHERLREEDPFTEVWTAAAGTRIVGRRSRFEVDLNRPRDEAVYAGPDQAWGLHVWREPLPREVLERSLAEYDAFYAMLDGELQRLVRRNGRVLVLDLHSYNHRREGAFEPLADPEKNPDVNLGTGSLRGRWRAVVEAFLATMGGRIVGDRRLDVRENVRFQGGYMSRWIHEHFPGTVCVLAIEVKKFFMDEWTGVPDWATVEGVGRAIAETAPALLEALRPTQREST